MDSDKYKVKTYKFQHDIEIKTAEVLFRYTTKSIVDLILSLFFL